MSLFFLAAIFYCGFTDFKDRIIPNVITIPMAITGLIYHIYLGEFIHSLLGIILCFTIGLICWLSGGIGGGDCKMMAGIGAWVGIYSSIDILFIASIIGIIWWIIETIKNKMFTEKAVSIFRKFILLRAIGIKNVVYKTNNAVLIPYGTCLAIATLFIFFTDKHIVESFIR